MQKKILNDILSIILGITGGVIIYTVSPKVAIGVFIVLWGNNIMLNRNTSDTENIDRMVAKFHAKRQGKSD